MKKDIRSFIPSEIKKIKYICKGVGTFLPSHQLQFYGTGKIREDSMPAFLVARTCYSIWLRNLVALNKNNLKIEGMKMLMEIGPGDSLGIGLAALLSGFNRYVALDVIENAFNSSNLDVFEELIKLFSNKSTIPDNNELPKAEPILDSYEFPRDIFTDEKLKANLDAERLKRIRGVLKKIISGEKKYSDAEISINYIAPLEKYKIEEGSVDLACSFAVMEHVEDIKNIYSSIGKWLKVGGVFIHTVDFKSHGTSPQWNGHWTYSDYIWKMVRGKSFYFINREPYSAHLTEIKNSGCSVACGIKKYRKNELNKKYLARKFKNLNGEDLEISSAVIGGVKL